MYVFNGLVSMRNLVRDSMADIFNNEPLNKLAKLLSKQNI